MGFMLVLRMAGCRYQQALPVFFYPGPAYGRKDRWYKCAGQPAGQADKKSPAGLCCRACKNYSFKNNYTYFVTPGMATG